MQDTLTSTRSTSPGAVDVLSDQAVSTDKLDLGQLAGKRAEEELASLNNRYVWLQFGAIVLLLGVWVTMSVISGLLVREAAATATVVGLLSLLRTLSYRAEK